MVTKIIWSDFALQQLKKIHKFYKLKASEEIAQKLTKSIVQSTIQLKTHPQIGTIEPLLKDYEFEYRYLVRKHYKIIYRLDNNLVRVISVFDTRQNPKKIRKFSDR